MAKNSYGWASPAAATSARGRDTSAAPGGFSSAHTPTTGNFQSDYGSYNIGGATPRGNVQGYRDTSPALDVTRTPAQAPRPNPAQPYTPPPYTPPARTSPAPLPHQGGRQDGRWPPPGGQQMSMASQMGGGTPNMAQSQMGRGNVSTSGGSLDMGNVSYGTRGGGGMQPTGVTGQMSGGGQQGMGAQGQMGNMSMAAAGAPRPPGTGPAPQMPSVPGAPPNLPPGWESFLPGGMFGPGAGAGDMNRGQQWSGSFFQPMLNYMGQGQDRDLNREQFNANLGFQRDNAQFSQGMERDRFGLERDSFNLGSQQFDRNFGENARRYDQDFGEDQRRHGLEFGEGQRQFDTTTGLNYDRMGNEDARARALAQLNANVDMRGQNMNDLRNVRETQLGWGGLQNQANISQLQANTQMRGQDVDVYGIDQRTGVDLRGQDVNVYGINTNAAVDRERMQNDLMQSRYATFGRAQQPNFRMVGGWR